MSNQNQGQESRDDFVESSSHEDTVFDGRNDGPMDTNENPDELPGDHGLGINSKFVKKRDEGDLTDEIT